MTASLPVPNDIDPEEPDGHDSAPIVSLPSSPKAPSVERKAPRKKAAKGKTRFVLLQSIGRAELRGDVDEALVRKAIVAAAQ